MLTSADLNNGMPPTIYRTALEIRRDMSRINEKINEAHRMLNIRALLIDLLSSEEYNDPKNMIEELSLAIEEARGALAVLGELGEELSDLEDELGETRWITRI